MRIALLSMNSLWEQDVVLNRYTVSSARTIRVNVEATSVKIHWTVPV